MRRGVLGGWEFVGNGDIIVMVVLLLLIPRARGVWDWMIQGAGTPMGQRWESGERWKGPPYSPLRAGLCCAWWPIAVEDGLGGGVVCPAGDLVDATLDLGLARHELWRLELVAVDKRGLALVRRHH